MATQIRVYKYGLQAPRTNRHLHEQMRQAHHYRNVLTEIERGRRDAIRALLASDTGTIALTAVADKAGAHYVAALKVLKDARKATRSRSETTAMKEALADARETKRIAFANLKAHRHAVRPTHTAELARIEGLATDLTKSARKYQSPYWGTYLLVEAAMEQARETTPFYEFDRPKNPRFVRLGGTERVGVQVQGGMPADEVFAQNRLVHIEPLDERAWWSESRGERRRLSRTKLHLRIDSAGRDPVWAIWPMVMHRPFPKNAVLKGVVVTKRMVGPRERWTACFTLEIPETPHKVPEAWVGVDLGWRLFEAADVPRRKQDGTYEPSCGNTIRAGTWVNTAGEKGEMRISAIVLSAIAKADSLRSIRDRSFDAMRGALYAWIKRPLGALPAETSSVPAETGRIVSNPLGGTETSTVAATNPLGDAETASAVVKNPLGGAETAVETSRDHSLRLLAVLQRETAERAARTWKIPDGFLDATAYLPLWKAPAKLAALARRWATARFPGDKVAFDALTAWATQDHHLWTWETSQRRKALDRRREEYRIFAAKLADTHGTLVLEGDLDLRDFAKKNLPEEVGEVMAQRRQRQNAGPGELREVLVNAFSSRGRYVLYVPCPNTTRRCHECHHINVFDAANNLRYACQVCGVVWDQDENAGENFLQLAAGRDPEKEKVLADLAKEAKRSLKGGSWATAKAKKKEKQSVKEMKSAAE